MPARILIIEDEAVVALELRFVLEDLGHEVVGVAADAGNGLNMVRETDVDLALVDIHLQDGPTGVELGRDIAAHGVTVLYMTANPGMVRNGVPGTLGVLTKPADEASVETAVAYALGLRRGRSAPEAAPPPALELFT